MQYLNLFKNVSIFFFVISMIACSSSSDSKDGLLSNIKSAEDALYENKDQLEFDKSKAETLVKAYNNYANALPTDSLSPTYLFKSAEVLRSLRKFNEAVGIYQKIGDNYPNYEKAPHSLFLLGFSYENDLGALKEAEKCYKDFLGKYPSHELADDVQFSLNNLGKSPEEIIKEFERKRKEQQEKSAGS